MWQVEVSHKSEMAGPFNRGDTIINKHLFRELIYISKCKILHENILITVDKTCEKFLR